MKSLLKFTTITISCLLLGNSVFGSEIVKKNISFFVDHATTNVTGICNEINIDPLSIKLVGNNYVLKGSFQINIPVIKISSGDDSRDSHIKEILGYPEFPLIQIKIESVSAGDEGYTVKGKLTIHGTTKDFTSIAKLDATDPELIKIEGKVIAKFSEYNIENPSLLFMKAKDNIDIKYSFQIKLK